MYFLICCDIYYQHVIYNYLDSRKILTESYRSDARRLCKE